MNPPDSPDPLPAALQAWQLTPRRNPQFRADVWARIESSRRGLAWGQYVRAHARMVATALVLAVAVGAFAGREQARTRVAESSTELARVYVQGLDARAMRMP